MNQHPKVTVAWALNGLEAALDYLDEGSAERRVRNQFHQLVVALERDGYTFDVQRLARSSPPDGQLPLAGSRAATALLP